MEKLKFKVWDPEDGYWVTSQHISKIVYRYEELSLEEAAEAIKFLRNAGHGYIIEQNTGMEDKNGKAIYTGDILESDDGRCGYVSYDCFYGEYTLCSESGRAFYPWNWAKECKELKVVDTIHNRDEYEH